MYLRTGMTIEYSNSFVTMYLLYVCIVPREQVDSAGLREGVQVSSESTGVGVQ